MESQIESRAARWESAPSATTLVATISDSPSVHSTHWSRKPPASNVDGGSATTSAALCPWPKNPAATNSSHVETACGGKGMRARLIGLHVGKECAGEDLLAPSLQHHHAVDCRFPRSKTLAITRAL